MKTQDRVQFVKRSFIQPHQLKTILLIVLSAFAVGSLPIVYGGKTADTNTAPPTEATFWKAMYE